jgi:hypothetical protein
MSEETYHEKFKELAELRRRIQKLASDLFLASDHEEFAVARTRMSIAIGRATVLKHELLDHERQS